MFYGSGTTAAVTTDDSVVTVISSTNMPKTVRNARIVNAGSVAGFFSLDGGTTWAYLPASYDLPIEGAAGIQSVLIKRIPSGSNLASVYATVWG